MTVKQVHTEVSGQSHHDCRHVHEHKLHGAEQSQWQGLGHVLLCERHRVMTLMLSVTDHEVWGNLAGQRK